MTKTKTRTAEIAGGGAAGLTVATALAQRGWRVRLHEKAEQLRPDGAGIVLWANSLIVLKELGALPDLMSNSMTPPCYETRLNNRIVSQESLADVTWRTMTRAHLHGVLLTAAQEAGVEILVNSKVTSASADGTVTVAGETYHADLVVGADGVGSAVRDSLGFALKRERAADGISRFLVPRHKDELAALEPETNWDHMIDFWNVEPKVLRVLYTPCNDKELYLALMSPAADARGSKVPIDLAYWTETFPHLEPVLREVAAITGRHFRYQTTRLENWTQGRVALIGDAAHAMCPALAQGAGCAMVNAYTLAQAASDADVKNLPEALAAWEVRERPITDRCQTRSQYYAESRGMSQGNQFTDEVLETARYDPTDPSRTSAPLERGAAALAAVAELAESAAPDQPRGSDD